MRFVFGYSELRKLQAYQNDKATIDAYQGVYIHSPRLKGSLPCGRLWVYYNTFGVGFCVARSMVSGQCEGLE
ncbi:MAG: hypothetical protein IKQ68_05540 [Prevotella sp.]|nr:hypothetical protein [Prevotella sp.]